VHDAGAGGADHWQAVAQRISAALAGDSRLEKDEIEVFVSGLLVTLRGQVRSDRERHRALELARRNAEPYMMVYDGLRVVGPHR
jgi:osmotically-inducible protein OsmY